MALSFTVNCAAAMLTGMKNHIGNGTGKIALQIYGGTAPANADTSVSDTPLVTFELDPPFSGDPANKTLTALPFPTTTASVAGTATFFRITRTGTTYIQGSVSEAGGSGDLKLNKIAIVKDEEVRVIEVKFQLP